jgi:hypothetical protein
MNYSLSNMLKANRVGAFDPDATAYINSIVATGTSVPSASRNAINDFFKIGKSQGWYAQLRRIYLPIWGAAAPNAIDMVTRSSGTFVGGVTPGAGFVQGNGTNGYFDMGVSASTLGLTPSAGGLFVLSSLADSRTDFRCLIGASNGGSVGENYLASDSATNLRFSYNTFATSLLGPLARASQNGILTADRVGGALNIRRRNLTTASSIATVVRANAGAVATNNIFVGALNSSGTPLFFSNAQLGSYGATLGLTTTQADQFTAALQALWTTCTGLSLP